MKASGGKVNTGSTTAEQGDPREEGEKAIDPYTLITKHLSSEADRLFSQGPVSKDKQSFLKKAKIFEESSSKGQRYLLSEELKDNGVQAQVCSGTRHSLSSSLRPT